MIVDRVVKKYQQEKDFEEFFSKERINNLNDDKGKNWKLCLLHYKFDPFIF